MRRYYKNLLDEDEVIVLHQHLLRPWASKESIFADKALSLFLAAGEYSKVRQIDPIRTLFDMAIDNPTTALQGMEAVPSAKRHIRIFTNGTPPSQIQEDRFVTSALGNFTTRLFGYQKHLNTIAPTQTRRILPADWAEKRSTIYFTYSLPDLQAVGGLIAAILMGLIRHRIQQGGGTKMLVAIDELPALGLRDINRYLATCGGYEINLLLYAQSIDQLRHLYGEAESNVLLDNCAHQVWYAPNELATAQKMSDLYGQMLMTTPTHSRSQSQFRQRDGHNRLQRGESASYVWRERAVLTPTQILGLPEDTVLVKTKQRPYPAIFLGKRLNPIHRFSQLHSPEILYLPKPEVVHRQLPNWASPPSEEGEAF